MRYGPQSGGVPWKAVPELLFVSDGVVSVDREYRTRANTSKHYRIKKLLLGPKIEVGSLLMNRLTRLIFPLTLIVALTLACRRIYVVSNVLRLWLVSANCPVPLGRSLAL